MEFTPSTRPGLEVILSRCTVIWAAMKTTTTGARDGPWVNHVGIKCNLLFIMWCDPVFILFLLLLYIYTLNHLKRHDSGVNQMIGKIKNFKPILGFYFMLWNKTDKFILQPSGDSEEIWWQCELLQVMVGLQEWLWECRWRILAGWETKITEHVNLT